MRLLVLNYLWSWYLFKRCTLFWKLTIVILVDIWRFCLTFVSLLPIELILPGAYEVGSSQA